MPHVTGQLKFQAYPQQGSVYQPTNSQPHIDGVGGSGTALPHGTVSLPDRQPQL
jgi:hypothetical protein